MPPFPKPRFAYDYSVRREIAALRRYRDTATGRQVPAKADGRLLVATWNVANLGVQHREERDYQLIAELVSWFDLIAIQEVNDNLVGLLAIREHLPAHYRLLFSGAGGNEERQAFFYDERRVNLLEEVGQLVIPPSRLKHIKPPGTTTPFEGFDRGPYLATFQADRFRFQLVNVHLFYGSESRTDIERRIRETYALAWWASRRHDDDHTYVPDMIPLGDFNLPKDEASDGIYRALTSRGLVIPPHTSQIGSSIAADNHYDQVLFFPGSTEQRFTGEMNVFDFDGAMFRDLFESRPREQFLAYLRYYISDHRPLWAQFHTT